MKCETCGKIVKNKEEAVKLGWQSIADVFWFWHHYCKNCYLGLV